VCDPAMVDRGDPVAVGCFRQKIAAQMKNHSRRMLRVTETSEYLRRALGSVFEHPIACKVGAGRRCLHDCLTRSRRGRVRPSRCLPPATPQWANARKNEPPPGVPTTWPGWPKFGRGPRFGVETQPFGTLAFRVGRRVRISFAPAWSPLRTTVAVSDAGRCR
jgi:hypothetical protein